MLDFHRNTNSERLQSNHIPQQPLWLAIIRVVQGLFNILVLSLAAAAASDYYLNGYGMAFFTFAWTVLFLLYIYLTPNFFPHVYHFWAHVGFEALTTIFWLVTFALLADYVRAWSDFLGRAFIRSKIISCTEAAMAFALLNWLLFCVTLAATLFIGRKHGLISARVDGTHPTNSETHHSAPGPTTGGGFFGGLFGSRKDKSADVEKNGVGAGGLGGGPVNETGQPIELNDRDAQYGAEQGAYGHNGGYGNAVDGGHQHHDQGPPPPASYQR